MSDRRYRERRTRVFTSALACMTLLAAAAVIGTAQNAAKPAVAKVYKRIPDAEIRKHVDRDWVRKAAVNDLLDYWVKAAVMPNGFIQENLDRQWKPWGEQREASLNGQGRVLYTLAVGYEMS